MLVKKFELVKGNILFAFTLLSFQQIIVASSTVWITSLIASIQEGQFSYYYLSLYLSALMLPYVPGALALIQIAKAKVNGNLSFIKKFTEIHRGKLALWTNNNQHASQTSILTGEAPQTINGYIDYIYHFAACGLNVIFNLVVIALIIDPMLFLTYLIGVFFALIILKLQQHRKKILSLRSQQGRIKWISMLLNAWDNVLINNNYNFTIWQKKTVQRGKRLAVSQIKLENLSQAVSISMAFALFIPTLVLICYLPVLTNYNLTKLAILVVTLPRLFQILSYSYELLFVSSDWPYQNNRLKTVLNLLDSTEEADSDQIRKRIQWDKIHIFLDNQKLFSPEFLLNQLPETGRYTVKGDNGVGKSSLLQLLKMVKGQNAFYLPVKHDLAFLQSKDGLSTGQKAGKIMYELSEQLEAQILLLDEWDANLDVTNQQQLSQVIDQIARNKCVIEVRHR